MYTQYAFYYVNAKTSLIKVLVDNSKTFVNERQVRRKRVTEGRFMYQVN